MAFHAIKAGEGEAFVAGGVESTSQVSGYPKSEEELHPALFGDDAPIANVYIPMGLTAENVAERWDVSREDMDRFAQQSQERAVAAQDSGFFAREITPYDGVEADDGPRRTSTYEKLAALDPAFKPGGKVTAGNACPLNDGAAAVVVMSASRAAELGIRPRARILASSVSGVEPEIMGVGPIEAVRKVLAQAGMTIDDVEVMELNEAFAAQVLPVCRELGVDPWSDKLNPHGGAIAVGHPYGMTGRADHEHAAQRPRDDGPDDRPRDDVRRRRPGHGDARGAAELALSALALVLALGSSIVWGTADFCGGSLTKRLPTFAVTVVSQAAGFAALAVVVAFHGDVGGRSFALGLLAGLGGGVGLAAFYRALSLGTMSVVSPVVACGALVPFVISIATGERPSKLALAGAVAALGGAVLASVEERRAASPARARAIGLAVVAAIALGLFVYFLGLGSRHGDALSTLFGARVGSLALLIVVASARARVHARPAPVAPRGRGRRARGRGGKRAVRVRRRPCAARARLGARLAVSRRHGAARARRPRRAPDAHPEDGRRGRPGRRRRNRERLRSATDRGPVERS